VQQQVVSGADSRRQAAGRQKQEGAKDRESGTRKTRKGRDQRRVAGWGRRRGQMCDWSHLESGERETGITLLES